jgi:hypothetical protein
MQEFKVGETVVYTMSGYYYQGITLSKIVRETKKQYILENGRRYWKETLSEVGERYSRIGKFTDELKAKYKLQRKLSEVSVRLSKLNERRNHIKVKDLSKLGNAINLLDQLEKVLELK